MTEEPTRDYVYAIGHPHGFVKIGRSKKPRKRLETHQTSCPYDLWIIVQLPVRDGSSVERELHESFSERHVRGEWYDLRTDDYDALIELMRIAKAKGSVVSIDELDRHKTLVEAALR